MHNELNGKTRKPITVFFSYSHKDEKMKLRLEAHLSLLKREQIIEAWHDRKITPGSEWKGQIDQNLRSSDVILLLISADFLASDYCYDIELEIALAQHENGKARVVPIILRPCEWPLTPFGKLQALPRDGKPVCNYPTQDHAFNEITRGIRRIIEDLTSSTEAKYCDATVIDLSQKTSSTHHVKTIKKCNEIQIPDEVIQKLERMRIINALIKTDEEALFDDDLLSEYRNIQDDMVCEFMPLVKILVKAGLLTIDINIEDIDSIEQHSSLTGEPTAVFDNGNIWIDAEYCGGGLRNFPEES